MYKITGKIPTKTLTIIIPKVQIKYNGNDIAVVSSIIGIPAITLVTK